MLNASIPAKFHIVWGASAGSSYIRTIPQASQIGIQNGAASLTDGFPPDTFTPTNAGGVPPFGQDFNGILKQITAWNQWQAAGGAVPFDSAFAADNGGYPKNALIASTTFGNYWLSLIDNNTTNPDTGVGVSWVKVPLQPQAPAAAPVIALNNLYIGNNGTLPNTSIDVQAGYIVNTPDQRGLYGVTTKDIAVAWQAGSGNTVGGLDGTPPIGALKTVHIFLIEKIGLSVTQASRASNVATLTVPSHGLGAGGSFFPYGLGQGYDGAGATIASVVDANTITYTNTGSNQSTIVIPNGTLNAFDILCSGSLTTPNVPAGWTQRESLGSVLTDGSGNIRPFIQQGDYFSYKTSIVDFVQNAGSLNLTVQTLTSFTLPKGLVVEALFNTVFGNSGGGSAIHLLVSDPATTDTVNSSASAFVTSSANTSATDSSSQVRCLTNTNAQVNLQTSASPTTGLLFMNTRGWRDPRRRFY